MHGLIAGGTGAGKSALLITLIMELALNYDPSVLNFVLVDYKGGGTFTPLLKLPHCVQVVSDLKKSAVHRMFTSVRAELERRQQILGTADIVAYRKSARNVQEPLPHLMIIIDEYAEMILGEPGVPGRTGKHHPVGTLPGCASAACLPAAHRCDRPDA